MRQLPSDKYNVAWFKLAEFVARGEKERALGLYRLLIHSFDDKALAAQLEGDILLSFNDQAAVEKYAFAAQCYEKEGKLTEAALVLEHIFILQPEADETIKKLVGLYEQLGNKNRYIDILIVLAKKLIAQRHFDELKTTLSGIESLPTSAQAKIYQEVVTNLCQIKVSNEISRFYLETALDFFILQAEDSLNQFLESIKAVQEDLYQEACAYLKR